MKAAAAFFVLVTLCFFGTGNAENNVGAAAVAKLKSTTKLITSQLETYGSTLISDLKRKLVDQKYSVLTTLDSIINRTLDDVQATIDVAKANGKDAVNCYVLARLELRQTFYIDANMEMDRCTNNALAIVKPVKSNIDENVVIGNRLINQLDNININCLLFVHLNYQKCIEDKMPRLSFTVKNFEQTVNELRGTGNSLSLSAVTSACSCNQVSADTVRQAAADVRVSSTNCIDNV